jgi:hypothetical protein
MAQSQPSPSKEEMHMTQIDATAPATTSATLDRALTRLIESRNGWGRFRPVLFDLSPRWQWWMLVRTARRIPPFSLPKIPFETDLSEKAAPMRMIRECLRPQGVRFRDFLEWLLYAMGAFDVRAEPKGVASDLLRHWEETFDLRLMLDHPGDWLGYWYETEVASRSLKANSGFFSTPMSICELLVQITPPGLLDTVHEPCCGSGRMLMAASNYSICLSGQDINAELCQIATLNGWFYMPSLVMPCREIESFAENTLERKLKTTLTRRTMNHDRPRNPTRIYEEGSRY